jgi:MFS family permease
VTLLAFGVREPSQSQPRAVRGTLKWRELVAMPRAVWKVLALAAMLALGRATEAFLVLVTIDRGLPVALSPLALVAMNVVYAAMAYPAGRLADRMSHARLLAGAAAVLVPAQLALALGDGLFVSFAGIVLFGVHLAFSQGLLSASISRVAPPPMRATAFGMLHLANGLATIASGAIAGVAWALAGPQATFAIAAGFAALALLYCTQTSKSSTPTTDGVGSSP